MREKNRGEREEFLLKIRLYCYAQFPQHFQSGTVLARLRQHQSNQDAEWNGVQANVPQIPLWVVDVPAIVPLNDTLNVRADNTTSSFSLRVKPLPSFNVSIPFSTPAGCSILHQNSGMTIKLHSQRKIFLGMIVIPVSQKLPFEVNITCDSTILSAASPVIAFDRAESSDRLFDGLLVKDISLFAFSPAKITVTYRNGTKLGNTTRFPGGAVTFGLEVRSVLNDSFFGRTQSELAMSSASGLFPFRHS